MHKCTLLGVWEKRKLVEQQASLERLEACMHPSRIHTEYKTKKFSSSDDPNEAACYNDNSNDRTHGVGLKKANFFGLHDIYGNVSEFVWRWYKPYKKRDGRMLMSSDYSSGSQYSPDPSWERKGSFGPGCTLGFRLCRTIET